MRDEPKIRRPQVSSASSASKTNRDVWARSKKTIPGDMLHTSTHISHGLRPNKEMPIMGTLWALQFGNELEKALSQSSNHESVAMGQRMMSKFQVRQPLSGLRWIQRPAYVIHEGTVFPESISCSLLTSKGYGAGFAGYQHVKKLC